MFATSNNIAFLFLGVISKARSPVRSVRSLRTRSDAATVRFVPHSGSLAPLEHWRDLGFHPALRTIKQCDTNDSVPESI